MEIFFENRLDLPAWSAFSRSSSQSLAASSQLRCSLVHPPCSPWNPGLWDSWSRGGAGEFLYLVLFLPSYAYLPSLPSRLMPTGGRSSSHFICSHASQGEQVVAWGRLEALDGTTLRISLWCPSILFLSSWRKAYVGGDLGTTKLFS